MIFRFFLSMSWLSPAEYSDWCSLCCVVWNLSISHHEVFYVRVITKSLIMEILHFIYCVSHDLLLIFNYHRLSIIFDVAWISFCNVHGKKNFLYNYLHLFHDHYMILTCYHIYFYLARDFSFIKLIRKICSS